MIAKRVIHFIRLFFEAIGYMFVLLLVFVPIYSDSASKDKKHGYEVYHKMTEGIRKGYVDKTITLHDFEIYWNKYYSRAISRDHRGFIIAIMFISYEPDGSYICYGAPMTQVPTLYCDGKNNSND
jgi:hypothetical protein